MSDPKTIIARRPDAVVVPDNPARPIRFTAMTDTGQVVEVFCTPTEADKIGRKLIECAVLSLNLWRSTV